MHTKPVSRAVRPALLLALENRLNIFSNIRLGGTTIDIRTLRGQVVLYKPLPTPDIWDKLTPMSDKLFEILKSLLKERSQQQAWKDGNRNNTLYKEACLDIERNQGRNIPALIEKAKLVGLPKHEIKETTKSALKKVITGTHGIDPGPSLNDQYPTGANKKAIVTWVTAPKKNLPQSGCGLPLSLIAVCPCGQALQEKDARPPF